MDIQQTSIWSHTCRTPAATITPEQHFELFIVCLLFAYGAHVIYKMYYISIYHVDIYIYTFHDITSIMSNIGILYDLMLIKYAEFNFSKYSWHRMEIPTCPGMDDDERFTWDGFEYGCWKMLRAIYSYQGFLPIKHFQALCLPSDWPTCLHSKALYTSVRPRVWD